MIEIFLEKWHSTPIIKSCKYMTGYEQTNDGGEGKMAHKFIHSKDTDNLCLSCAPIQSCDFLNQLL